MARSLQFSLPFHSQSPLLPLVVPQPRLLPWLSHAWTFFVCHISYFQHVHLNIILSHRFSFIFFKVAEPFHLSQFLPIQVRLHVFFLFQISLLLVVWIFFHFLDYISNVKTLYLFLVFIVLASLLQNRTDLNNAFTDMELC